MFMQCPQKPEEDVTAPGTGVISHCELPAVDAEK